MFLAASRLGDCRIPDDAVSHLPVGRQLRVHLPVSLASLSVVCSRGGLFEAAVGVASCRLWFMLHFNWLRWSLRVAL